MNYCSAMHISVYTTLLLKQGMELSDRLFCMLLIALSLFTGLVVYSHHAYTLHASEVSSVSNNVQDDESGNNNEKSGINDRPYGHKRQSPQPIFNDPTLKLEQVTEGLNLPTQMAFLSQGDILVLEKDSGTVRRILNGNLLSEPVLDVSVANAFERGLLGIAISNNGNKIVEGNNKTVYLYYTESNEDGKDRCFDSAECEKENQPVGNRLYQYDFANDKLVNPKLLLDLPANPGASHNGGSLLIGPDNNIYLSIGEVSDPGGKISNHNNGRQPDGRGGILRISQDGQSVSGILGDTIPLRLYYAYGIRNSFGIGFDPLTGKLWDTENGPGFGDEINLVDPGFNSGWNRVQGFWERENYFGGPIAPNKPSSLVDFDGRGKYSSPEFTWNQPVGVTSIKFLDSNKLGKDYQNDLFVGDFSRGNLYHFDLNENRDKLVLHGVLGDEIADNDDELQSIVLADGFNGITDLEVGPDGDLYVLSFAGSIFKISR